MKPSRLQVLVVVAILGRATLSEAENVSFRESRVAAPTAGATAVIISGVAAWITELEANRIARFEPGEAVQEITIPTPGSGPSHIAAIAVPFGGELWFTESRSNKIGRIAGGTVVGEIDLPTPSSTPIGIADGGVESNPPNPARLRAFVTEFSGNKIALVRQDGVVQEYPIPTSDSGPWGIVTPDGETPGSAVGPLSEAWFTESKAGKIGRLAGESITEYATPTPNSGPREIVVAGDGSLWFTEYSVGKIGRITRSGVITEFSTSGPDTGPVGIAVGRAGDIWFTEQNAGRVGVITPDFSLKELSLPTAGSGPSGIALRSLTATVEHFSPPVRWELVVLEAGVGQVAWAKTDFVLVPGAGGSADWVTEFTIASRENFEVPTVLHFVQNQGTFIAPPPAGSVRFITTPTADWTSWVVNPNSFFVPSVHARIFQRSKPEVSASLPVIRLSTLLDLNADVLSFSGATRGPGGARSNLFLTAVTQDGLTTSTVRVEAFSPDGSALGASNFGIAKYLLIGDVLAQLGVSSLETGQIRVTRISGTAAVWGYLATLKADGALSISSGAVP
jgi:virginiamycin B lyase